MTGSTWTERTLAALRAAGYRSGGARTAVVELLGRQDCCLTAKEISDSLRTERRPVGIASVYRVLELLAERRLVQRIDLGAGTARYEPIHTGGDHHHHLVCDECGRVEAFSNDRLEGALRKVEQTAQYTVESHDVVLRGACDDCKEPTTNF